MTNKKLYTVDWSKAYFSYGSVEIEASSVEEAEEIVDQQIGDYEGNMQYDPDGNSIVAYEDND